ncbi:substrate-binding domain-containing protein [Aneurinibacillus sp. REN35]|uniref:substrate-binding domain-containing protein n=1 Tax=Aneurinibacillus sp. REN35 TaxID=3237286 RepID=UPI003528887B
MKNKLFIAGIVLVFGTLLAACGDSETSGSGDKKTKLGVTVITAQHAFYVDVINGMKEEAKAKGVDIMVSDPNSDLAKQTNQIKDFIEQKVNGMIVYGVDPKAVVPSVEEAVNAKIPVVTADMKLETDKVATFIGTDNKAAGKMAGDYAAKYIKEKFDGKANVGILVWESSVAQKDRAKGFIEGVSSLSGVKVVSTLPGNDQDTSLKSTQNMLQANPDLDVIFTTNEGGALGAVNALQIVGNKNVKIIGFDITDQLSKAIEDEAVLATIAQQPKLMGKMAVDSALDAIDGKKLDPITPLPVQLVTKDNVKDFK